MAAYMLGGKKIEIRKPGRQLEQTFEREENRQRRGEPELLFG